MPGFSRCCAGIGDSGSFNTRGGAPRKAASFAAADSAVDFVADFFAEPFFEDCFPPFFAPCLFDFVAISSPTEKDLAVGHTLTDVCLTIVRGSSLRGDWYGRIIGRPRHGFLV